MEKKCTTVLSIHNVDEKEINWSIIIYEPQYFCGSGSSHVPTYISAT